MSIQSTVSKAMQDNGLARHESKADPIVTVLVERERNGAQKILDYAASKGADVDDVRDFLIDLGVEVPDEADDDTDTDNSDYLVKVVSGLLEFARSKGYRG